MCQSHRQLEHHHRYNWDGDKIIYRPVVAHVRAVTQTRKRYDLDPRELLLNKHNSVVDRTLADARKALGRSHRYRFESRKPGSFDLQMRILREYIERTVRYTQRGSIGRDWMFPDETLRMGQGDCEDRAILYAALALAAGVSAYNIRVVLGKIRIPGTNTWRDHVWVNYKTEAGLWQRMELREYNRKTPAVAARPGTISGDLEYVPIYAFNPDHLWYVENKLQEDTFGEYVKNRRFWKDYDPTFGYSTHQGIVQSAIAATAFTQKVPQTALDKCFYFRWEATSDDYLQAFAGMVADVDITLNYRQELHFDNGRIGEAADRMLHNFGSGRLGDFATACHTLADFYAHTSFPYFAKPVSGSSPGIQLAEFTGKKESPVSDAELDRSPDYSVGEFCLNRFSTNTNVFKGNNPATGNPLTKADAIAFWQGKVISGRFGQHGDSKSFLERFQYADESLPNYVMCGALPHHNEIAVDDRKKPTNHVLYTDPKEFEAANQTRVNAAIRHTAQLFAQWKPV
jgi:hypothetical protein